MIHIIGTAHGKTQYWSDLIRKAESLDTCPVIVERFESYLQDAAISLNATAIAEENSKQLVDQLEGGSSVAKKVAEELDLRHAYCDPDLDERASLGVGIHKEDREPIWMVPAKESDSPLPRQHSSPETAQSSQYTAPPRIRDCERFQRGSP